MFGPSGNPLPVVSRAGLGPAVLGGLTRTAPSKEQECQGADCPASPARQRLRYWSKSDIKKKQVLLKETPSLLELHVDEIVNEFFSSIYMYQDECPSLPTPSHCWVGIR